LLCIELRFEISPHSLRSGLRPFEITVLFIAHKNVKYFQNRAFSLRQEGI